MAAIPLNPGIIDTDMLRIAFGGRASGFGDADAWAIAAALFLAWIFPRKTTASRLRCLGNERKGFPLRLHDHFIPTNGIREFLDFETAYGFRRVQHEDSTRLTGR